MADKQIRVWNGYRKGDVQWIITDDTPKRNAMYPTKVIGDGHTGMFGGTSARAQLIRNEFMHDHYKTTNGHYKIPLRSYVLACEYAGIDPFPNIKVSQVVTTYEDKE